MAGRVAGKVALVTGGASGIGQGCAELLAAEGARVVVTDVQVERGKAVVDGINARGGEAVFMTQDVTREEGWEQVIADTRKVYGRLDILVNNAGIAIGGPIHSFSFADWKKQQAVNEDGVFLGTKHGLGLMRESGGGSIINISSVAGMKGSAGLAAYCATKGAVRLFSKAVAMECAAAKDGIRVNSVHPGIIDTPIWDGIGSTLDGPSNAGGRTLDLNDVAAVATPLGFKGEPADIAAGVLYLASDESRYVTGIELIIDGGMVTR
ncbi:NAD(P)-dependent dehydrogenase (short-subunit alcohol dehydrogenase family) [Caulobacter ginsengisoli]|uniref:NAD(P)-dependent dehydrogenase (Short-subunit alcohol dehydrogenase family) n=1 Tax=Caulobacter ginsengisoli TaxID=400775 RepID=A0ABU0IVQ4_9CAUL|nr:glucose 1-dehydrogenase [Caulobacter ginsengisoli]MDQ0466105.1 NAD(P)-dependent dehydrogenase (short-subunit alcohol dehydrogenase family) [Caulobacter ginsengisoli]